MSSGDEIIRTGRIQRCARRGIYWLALMLSATLWSQTAQGQAAGGSESKLDLMDVHATLGVVALGAFSTSLVVGAASGNLGKLMDPGACCPDGGRPRADPQAPVARLRMAQA